MAKEFLDKVKEAEQNAEQGVIAAKAKAEKILEEGRRDAVDYINDITDKAQKYASEKLMKAEKKAQKILDDTKADSKSTARSLNNIVNKKSGEIKSALDSILFD